ncbi:hypothetical protein LguiB_027793 [Lonicera macranthoides]
MELEEEEKNIENKWKLLFQLRAIAATAAHLYWRTSKLTHGVEANRRRPLSTAAAVALLPTETLGISMKGVEISGGPQGPRLPCYLTIYLSMGTLTSGPTYTAGNQTTPFTWQNLKSSD